MKLKKIFLLPLVCMAIAGCNQTGGSTPSSSSSCDCAAKLDNIETEVFMRFPNIKMEVNQRLCIDNYVIENDDSEILIRDESIVKFEDNNLYGLKEGETYLLIKNGDKHQKVEIEVKAEGTFSSAWNFDDMVKGQKIVAFGDSVTADATINADLTYTRLIARKYGLDFKKNYAIGGTTGTYMYEGSNIYKEYRTLKDVIEGPRRVKNAVDAGEIDDVDYAIIAYGHNDQYFQPPITVEGDDAYNVDNFDNAHSFKGSYRFMVNYLRKANPNIKIILLNCTYSEYWAEGGRPYGDTLGYDDYRKAITELAEELDCKTVDPWNYTKTLFDGRKANPVYYKDVVHLSVNGHSKLYKYLIKY